MRLLVVEDEINLAKALVKGLNKLNYSTDVATDGELALELFFSYEYDLIILDLNLPKIDGINVLKEIRKDNLDIKVIILSARSEVEDKIVGLDLGANDYLSKPFHFKELEARIRALLRRDFRSQEEIIFLKGDLSMDLRRKRVVLQGKEIHFTPKEYSILEYLASNKGMPVTSGEILEHIGNIDTNELSAVIKVHIGSIRKKLGNDYVKTARGKGYYVE